MDLEASFRIREIVKALDKMHNGLLAMIDEHQKYVEKTDARIAYLEELVRNRNPKE